jgi:large subunit ribosomal protein L18
MANSKQAFERRRERVRRSVKKAANGRPRLSIYRSSKHIYAQIIDDAQGHTLVSASTMEKI